MFKDESKKNSLKNYSIQKQLLLMLGEFQHFIVHIFKHIEKLKEFYTEYSCTHHPDSTVNILLCLLYHMFLFIIHHSIFF